MVKADALTVLHDPGTWQEDELLRDRHWSCVLRSGLRLVVTPRRGFNSNAAMVAFRVGSIDQSWAAGSRHQTAPAGSAHFLEHQLFKKSNGDLSAAFDRTGANCNAYTTHNSTSFHFEGVSNFRENLDTLLRLGLEPHFDQRLVDTERSIIEQELARYEDDPGSVAWNALVSAMYHNHPIRDDIVGTRVSLSRINAKTLGLFHSTFYHPANACLFVSGDLTPAQVQDAAESSLDRHYDGRPFDLPAPASVLEPHGVKRERVEKRFPAPLNWYLLGWKLTPGEDIGLDTLRRVSLTTAGLILAFGQGTPFHEMILREGLAVDGVGIMCQPVRGALYAVISAETPRLRELEAALKKRMDEVSRTGVDATLLAAHQRKLYGWGVMGAESPEAANGVHEASWVAGVDPYLAARIPLEITHHEVMQAWHAMLGSPSSTVLMRGRS